MIHSPNKRYKKSWKILPLLLLFGFTGIFSACYKTTPAATGGSVSTLLQPLQSILQNNADFHDFDTLLKKSGLYQRVTGTDSAFTLLIPDNQAFVTAGLSLDSLLQMSPDSLRAFVGYHILAGSILTSTVPQTITNPYTTLSGQTLYLSKPLPVKAGGDAQQLAQLSKTLNVNGIPTKQVDLVATNGVVQVLNTPLSPPYPSIQAWLSRSEYSYLVAALKKFNCWNQLDSAGPYTLFAPVNDAFLRNNITLDMINSDTFDLRHYEPYLFSAGILPGRIFLTDFSDAPVMYGGQPAYNPAVYSVYGSVLFGNINSNYLPPPTVVAQDWTPGPYGGYNQIGGNPNYTVTNQPAINGVINGIDDLLVYPDAVYIPQ